MFEGTIEQMVLYKPAFRLFRTSLELQITFGLGLEFSDLGRFRPDLIDLFKINLANGVIAS